MAVFCLWTDNGIGSYRSLLANKFGTGCTECSCSSLSYDDMTERCVEHGYPTYDSVELTVHGFVLRDEETDEDQYVDALDSMILPNYPSCIYCSSDLIKAKGEDQEDGRLLRKYFLWYCRNCRFWQSRIYSDPYGGCMLGPDNRAYISKLRDFSTELPDGCPSELGSFLRRNPDFLHLVAPPKFEKLVADIFRANFKTSEVMHVGRPDDGGVDVLMVDSDDKQWLIQVKRRGSAKASEGIATIRDMLGAMILSGTPRSIIVSKCESVFNASTTSRGNR